MTAQHAPTPWMDLNGHVIIPAAHADRKIGGSTDPKEDRTEFAHTICRIERNSNRFTADEASANAAFIVKAVNHHDQLVQAVKDLLEYAGIIEERCDSVATDAARAALAAVEVQP